MGIQKYNKIPVTKSSCRNNFAKEIAQKIPTDFYLIFITFLGVSQRGESKNTTKKIKICGHVICHCFGL
jgi:hypothetical protein